ncbi:MAG: hypothetical protein DI535_24540 [Citrobacter freundii]|nr:MAG: hypothetical protein DI535_24540 [Citrobacter freundii]
MRQKLTSRTILLSIALAGACMVLFAAIPGNTSKANSGNEEESMESCVKKDEKGGGVIWENISHQFFSSF